MAVVAGAAMLVGCNKEVDLGPAKLALDQTTLAFEAAGGSQTVSVTATRDWAVSGVPDWVALSATSGKAAVEAQPVKITVAQNAEYNRSATIVFTIGFARTNLTINQAGPEGEIDNGDGTLENPFNVAGVLEYTRSLPADQASENNVFFQGKISKVTTTFEASNTYGNATFYVVDEDGGESFYVYQTYYLGNRKWKSGDTDVKEGDEVIICGKVVNFKGNTPETVSKGGSFIYSLNGKSEGGAPGDDDYTKAEAKTVAEFIQLADETKYYKLTGKVSKFNKTYCSFDLTDDSGTIYVFSVLDAYKTDEWKNKIKNGGTITIAGKYEYYASKEQHEVVNAAILEYSDGEGGDEDYSKAEAKTVAEFITAADENTYYKLTGTVGGSINTTYGNFDLTDASGTIFVYGTQNWSEWKDKVKNGSTVTLAAKYKLYKKEGQPDKDEAIDAYILSCDGGDEPGGEPEIKSVTNAEFLAAEVSTTQWYELTGTVSNIVSTVYGNFDLTDAAGTKVYVYGLTSAKVDKNDKSFESLGIKEGDNITIITLRAAYQGSPQAGGTPPAYLKSINTGGDEPGGDEPGGEPEIKSVTNAEFLAAEVSTTQWYELTGTVSNIVSTVYGNFDLTDAAGTKVYVYGLTSAKVDKNDKSFESLGIKEGDNITIITLRAAYQGSPQAGGTPPAYLKSINSTAGGDEPGGGDEPSGEYASNVSWTLGTNAAEAKATVNNVAGVSTLKLGTSKAAGTATLTVPSGASKITFYAISWKDKPSTLVFKNGDAELGSVSPAANSGLSGNPPFTFTVADTDKFEIAVNGATTVTVETSGSNTRAVLFAIVAE